MDPKHYRDVPAASLDKTIQYLAEERRDYDAQSVEGQTPADHIYPAIRDVQPWLDKQRAAGELDRSPATPAPPNCNCGGTFSRIDSHGQSETVRCESCQECFLIVHDGRGDPAVICLWEFDRRRGDGEYQRPLDDHRMAEQLMVALAADCWPSPATAVNFGVESPRHFGALQEAARAGITAYELDRVLGDGQAITELVKATAAAPTRDIEYRTPAEDWCTAKCHAERVSASNVARNDRNGNPWFELLDRKADHEPEIER